METVTLNAVFFQGRVSHTTQIYLMDFGQKEGGRGNSAIL
jgi:hypothetical protein